MGLMRSLSNGQLKSNRLCQPDNEWVQPWAWQPGASAHQQTVTAGTPPEKIAHETHRDGHARQLGKHGRRGQPKPSQDVPL